MKPGTSCTTRKVQRRVGAFRRPCRVACGRGVFVGRCILLTIPACNTPLSPVLAHCPAVAVGILERFGSSVSVAENVGLPPSIPSTAVTDRMLVSCTNYSPRLGSFEVVALLPSGKLVLVFSKLITTTWPSMTEVVARLEDLHRFVADDDTGRRHPPEFYRADDVQRTAPSPTRSRPLGTSASGVTLLSRSTSTPSATVPRVRPLSGT